MPNIAKIHDKMSIFVKVVLLRHNQCTIASTGRRTVRILCLTAATNNKNKQTKFNL